MPTSPPETRSSNAVPWMIYAYMWVLFGALPVILYVRHTGNPAALPIDWSLHGMFANDIGEPLTLALYVLGLGQFFLAALVPALLRARIPPGAAAGRHLVPYIVRLTLIEVGVLFGFVIAISKEKPLCIVPFLLIGAACMVLSPPPKRGNAG